MTGSQRLVNAGDLLALLVSTWIGFVTHGEGTLNFLPRFLAAYIPMALAWMCFAPVFGLSQPEKRSLAYTWWRILWAMSAVAPLAVTVRSALLATEVKPVFVLVFGVTSALGLIVWRSLQPLFSRS